MKNRVFIIAFTSITVPLILLDLALYLYAPILAPNLNAPVALGFLVFILPFSFAVAHIIRRHATGDTAPAPFTGVFGVGVRVAFYCVLGSYLSYLFVVLAMVLGSMVLKTMQGYEETWLYILLHTVFSLLYLAGITLLPIRNIPINALDVFVTKGCPFPQLVNWLATASYLFSVLSVFVIPLSGRIMPPFQLWYTTLAVEAVIAGAIWTHLRTRSMIRKQLRGMLPRPGVR